MCILRKIFPVAAALCGGVLFYSGAATGYTVTLQNNTGLDPGSYMICVQGFASSASSTLELGGSSGSYAFQPVASTGPLPAFQVTPGTTVTVGSATFDILGGRIYYYVTPLPPPQVPPQPPSCPSFLVYNGSGVTNNFQPGGAYVFSEITSIGTTNNTFDISMVDSFALPAQAFTTGNTAGYNTIGQTDVTLQSAQNLQAIRSDFVTAMTGLGAAGAPYIALAGGAFSNEGQSTWSYPPGTGPIMNPSTFLGQKISPVPASGVVYPGASSPLNSVFDSALNALFSTANSNKIYVNKTGNAGDTYVGVPVTTGLPYPNIVGSPNPYLPATLPGMVFCNSASPACTVLNAAYTAYNPVGMTITNRGAPDYGYLTGTWTNNTRTITLASALNVPALIDTAGLFVNGIAGWYVTGVDLDIATGSFYVVSCVPSCTSSAVTSITLDPSLPTEPTDVTGQLILQAWPPATGLGTPAPSSGLSVLGNVGVLGGIGWPKNDPDLINVIVSALNRGVSSLRSAQHDFQAPPVNTDSYVWADETQWYPSGPVINQYSNYLHTRVLGSGSAPLFARPNPSANSAQNMAMGMAYGFGWDEDPLTGRGGPAVPSKWDGKVNGDAAITLTFGPWLPQGQSQYLLQVNTAGTGASGGVITSISVSPPGPAIDCGSTCGVNYTAGTMVTLKASGTSTFTGWSGACTGTTLTCQVTMSQAQNVTANFASSGADYPLHVVVLGQGTVQGGGVNCGSTCSVEEASGSQVTLTATPQGGSTFVSWSGACSGSSATCLVTMSQAQQVTATFATAQQYSLTVTNGGGGLVTSTPTGIDCGAACVASFDSGKGVSVIARPAPGYVFSGWSGACSGTQTCDLVMNSNRAVGATFSLLPPGKVSLTVHDYGDGSVVSSPAGIICGSTCSYAFDVGTLVTLTALPATGWTFTGWSGNVCAGTGQCVVTLNQAQEVNAVFASNTPVQPTEIPTLSEWAQIILMLMLLGVAAGKLRARTIDR